MDGAAKKISYLAQRVLPDRPHHLAISPTKRYPVPRDFWQYNSRLQYTTYLSDADRGVLLTRPYYEIHESTGSDAPVDNARATPRSEVKKPVTKMSFKDYQQSKQKKMSESPPDSGPMDKGELRQKRPAEARPRETERGISGADKGPRKGATVEINGDR